MDSNKLQELLRLDAEAADLGEKLKAIAEGRAKLEAVLLEQFADDGINKVTVTGRTVFIKRDVFPKFVEGKSRADIIAWMKAKGNEEFADFLSENYNGNTFNAFVREIDREETEMPEGLGALIEISERFALKTKRG